MEIKFVWEDDIGVFKFLEMGIGMVFFRMCFIFDMEGCNLG